ncbi:hypothetical protein [Cupriavidus necator]
MLIERSVDLHVSRPRQRLNDDARELAYTRTARSEADMLPMPVEIKEVRQ